jgi:hypothetical protein
MNKRILGASCRSHIGTVETELTVFHDILLVNFRQKVQAPESNSVIIWSDKSSKCRIKALRRFVAVLVQTVQRGYPRDREVAAAEGQRGWGVFMTSP